MDRDLVIIALGSNLGDSRQLLTRAIEQLKQFASGSIRVSSFYRTAPVDCPPGSPDFLNAVAIFQVREKLSPIGLLDGLKELEKYYGRRQKSVHNEPRPLDLDIIAFGSERMATAKLVLPHPRAHQRRFVLEPLAELLPDFVLPGQNQSVNDLLDKVRSTQPIERLN
jgi:2-amino-4-hydroxy-6-hydroxymethyldihydropteridine diphosphokinase